jgi:YfiH family protein
MNLAPTLVPADHGGLRLATDPAAREAGVLVAFTDRRGGVSRRPFDSLNLAMSVGDDPSAVTTNRARVAQALGFDLDRLALARQVHGAELIEVTGGCSGVVGEADVLATSTPGQAIAILTADCTPVTIWGSRGVAIAHAGWRGLVAGAVERAVDWVGDPRAAWVGPSVRGCCYQVGPDVIDAFEQRGLPITDDRHVDPRDASLHVLKSCGVDAVATSNACTFMDGNYFSYRRDEITGRQGAFASLLP